MHEDAQRDATWWVKRGLRYGFAASVAATTVGVVSELIFKNIRLGPGGLFSMYAGVVECLVCAFASFVISVSDNRLAFRLVAGAVTGAGASLFCLIVPGVPDPLRAGFPAWVLPMVWMVQGSLAGVATGLIVDAFRRRENATWLLSCLLGVVPSSVVFCAALALCGNDEGIPGPLNILLSGLFGSLFAAPVCVVFGVLSMAVPVVMRFAPGVRTALRDGLVVGAVSGIVYATVVSVFKADLWSTFAMSPSPVWRAIIWTATGMLYATIAALIRHAVFAPAKKRRASRPETSQRVAHEPA